MPDDKMTRRSTLAALAGLGAGTVSLRALAAASVGEVTGVRGMAFAEVVGGARPLNEAAPVYLDEWLRTGEGARLSLMLGAKTTVRLGQTARLKIDRFVVDAGGVLELGGGPMLFAGPDNGFPRGLQVRSPSALIAVRGTQFFAGPSNGVFGVFVRDGVVSVRAAGRVTLLNAGQGVDIATPGGPATEPRGWGDARIAAALASVS